MKTTFVWLKLILLSALIVVAVFYEPEQKQGWYVLLFIEPTYWFVDGMENVPAKKHWPRYMPIKQNPTVGCSRT